MRNKKLDFLKRVKVHNWVYISGIITLIVLNLISWKSVRFSDWYVMNVFPLWLDSYARFTSLFPFSIGEIMLLLGAIITLALGLFALLNVFFKGKFSKYVKNYAKFYAWLFLVVAYVMTLNCFILYHCSGFSEKYNVKKSDSDAMVVSASNNLTDMVSISESDKTRTYTKKEMATLRDFIVEKCNELATDMDRDDDGTPLYDGNLIEASRDAMTQMGEYYEQLSGYYVNPKYLTCSGFFSQQNIMGYYFPFSMEANINSVMYITNVAPTVCHELAHTKGFIYEDDANMIGFLACINSDDKFLQYCGYLSVLNYVNNNFYESIDKDKTTYQKHVRISDIVADDNIFLSRESWEEVEKKAVINTDTVKKVSNSLMDTSLKLNGVDNGVLVYNDVVGLLLCYYDGELF